MYRILVLAALLLAAMVSPGSADERPDTPHTSAVEMKARHLFNFARFVNWPTGGVNAAPGGFNFCLLGDASVETALEHFMAGKRVQERVPRVLQTTGIGQVQGCGVVFFGKNYVYGPGDNAVIPIIPGTLTVGETPGFAERGGIIEFVVDDEGNLRFAVNLAAARQAGLALSSQLLKLAVVVLDDL